MPELTINPNEITEVLRKHLEGYKPTLDRQQVGQIVEVGDGIARISGLPTVSVNELLEFHGGALGLAVVATLSTSRTDSLLAGGDSTASALTGGFHLAFLIGAGLVVAAIAIGVSVLRPAAAVAEAAPEGAEAGASDGDPAYSEAA